jgi:flavin reductase (DIM6/NTAB) family NADH-FMN oxidoreductase RutF
MPVDARELRRVMGCFATGVTIITTRDAGGQPYGLTANAVTSVSLTPPLLLICVDRKAETFPHFFDSKLFVLNILAENQEELSRRFATSGGDKFGGVAYRLGRFGTPILQGTLGHVECRIVETHEAGDHVIHLGEVEHAESGDGRPLIFFRGGYRQLTGPA